MEWTKELMLKRAPEMAKQAKVRDFEGKTDDDFVAFMATVNEKGFKVPGLDTEDEIRKAWKTVEISFDSSTDDVNVTDMATASEDGEGEDDELKVTDTDSEETKQYKAMRRELREAGFGKPQMLKSLHEWGTGRSPAIHAGPERSSRKSYDRAAKEGTKYRGKTPVFHSADEAEYFGAAARLMITKGGMLRSYDRNQYANDCSIIGTKATGVTSDNAWAGTLIVHEVAPQIIDLLHTYGAMRECVGVTDMPDGSFSVKRKTGNMSFGYVDEAGAIPETNPTYDNVQLNAKKVAGIARASNELLDDSAWELGNEVALSSAVGAALFEDEDYFNGTYGGHGGLAGNVDADSTYDAALSSGWGDYTILKLQEWVAKVPAEAWKSGNVKIAASTPFYMAVLRRFALSAGGNLGGALLDGIGGGDGWDGIPYVRAEVLPSTYSGNQIVAFIGDFSRGTKFGVVRGSEQLDASDQRYWDTDEFAWRFKERIDFNFHDVGGTSSEIIALQD